MLKRLLTAVLLVAAAAQANANIAPTVSIFAPANNATFPSPANIQIWANASDADGTVAKVEFYNGTTLLATDTTAPYSFVWNNVAAGNYSITAKAIDNNGAATTSTAVNFSVTGSSNAPPTVSITAPANNASYTAPASVTLTANASDSDGTVSRVEYYRGSTLIGGATSSPYTVNWTNIAAGNYSITAKAIDNNGAATTSTAVNFSVTGSSNAPPTVSITAPANNATYTAPASVTLTASASDSDGTVSTVEYYRGSILIGGATSSPYTVNWTNIAAGNYSITAKAIDNNGAATTSTAVNISVTGSSNAPPTVGITAPANNASYTAPASVTLTASASDSDGTVSRVEYYRGSTLIGSATGSPYTVNWTNIAAGNYSIIARATDNSGATTTSAGVSIAVTTNSAPTVSITAPANNASYIAPASIALTANAADTDGTVAKVEFYNGTNLIGSATGSPYTVNWTNIAAGDYSITAKATDDKGATTTSSAITIAVKANAAPSVGISAPANSATYAAPANITLTANASDSDGTISQVAFYNGTALIGTNTAAPYSLDWNNVAAGNYSVTAVATDDRGTTNTSGAITITVVNNSAPTVSVSAGTPNGPAPATVALEATVADSDGTITKVEFYDRATLLATLTQAPYTYNWTDVAAGEHSVTAKATDNLGVSTISEAVTVRVKNPPATAYFIHSDHLNTPRLITDANNAAVWQWDSDPFGAAPPNDNPGNGGQPFAFNPRFPGQYFDKETNLFYNWHRTYDPQTGRYTTFDPIGLAGGINGYVYVANQPTRYTDPRGLDNPGMGPYGPYYAWTPWRPAADPGLTPVVPEAAFIPLLRLPRILDILNKRPDESAAAERCRIPENRTGKIFGDREGHLPDTLGNRQLIEDVANDSANALGRDKFGNDWFAKTQSDGSQVWAQTRNGEITNGGLNSTPNTFNPQTGLSSPVRPGWK